MVPMASTLAAPPVVIPAAGLGTRLRGVIPESAKELAVLGGEPVLLASLLEAAAVEAPAVVLVTSPAKPEIRATAERLLDRPALRRLSVTFVEQPTPAGVFDAVARAAAVLGADRMAVVFPDFVHLPDQTGLARVLAVANALPRSVSCYGVFRKTADHAARMGGSATVELGARGRITEVLDAPLQPDSWHTGLVELRGTAFVRQVAGRSDVDVLEVLRRLARERRLYGVPLEGNLLDVGVPAGWRDAVARFDRGEATWRDRDTSAPERRSD